MLPGEDLQGWGTEVYPGKSMKLETISKRHMLTI